MDYKCWTDDKGQAPVLQKLREIEVGDTNSAKSYNKHLDRLKKYSYIELARHKIIKKLKGKNPYKIHELRFVLPKKIARTFFVIARDSKLWLLHLMIKKKDSTNTKDIGTAEQRAEKLNKQINYL